MTTDRTLPVGRRQMGRCGPAHLAATAFDTRATLNWPYVVEGHASACPQTACVDVKFGRRLELLTCNGKVRCQL